MRSNLKTTIAIEWKKRENSLPQKPAKMKKKTKSVAFGEVFRLFDLESRVFLFLKYNEKYNSLTLHLYLLDSSI